MRLLISGYRYFRDYDTIEKEIKKVLDSKPNESHIIIHGNCSGVDTTADEIAKANELQRLVFFADWNQYGKAAGPIRNQQMIDEGKPDYAIIFLSPQSRGTLDMKNRLDKCKIKYTIVHL